MEKNYKLHIKKVRKLFATLITLSRKQEKVMN